MSEAEDRPDSDLAMLARAAASEMPPPEMDAKILSAARSAMAAGERSNKFFARGKIPWWSAMIAAAAAMLALAIFAAGYFRPGDSAPKLAANPPGVEVAVKSTDMVQGAANAPVTIVEYASLACPHCAEENNIVLPRLREAYINTGKVRYVLREFPLWAQGRMAAALARCQSGDNFFSLVDLLFARQAAWLIDAQGKPRATAESVMDGLADIGGVAGMNRGQVEACVNSPANLKIVDDNTMEAQTRYGVNSTPTFIIDGTIYRNELSYDDFERILKPLVR